VNPDGVDAAASAPTRYACGANADSRRANMTLCPIAIVVGCKKCPAFTVCPLKSVIGDYKKPDETQEPADKAKGGVKREGQP
jgi:Fe-S-cluster-containing hydrogenase component 2